MKEINSLYIHFPYCSSFCAYCDFYSELFDNKSQLAFQKYLIDALSIHSDILKKKDINLNYGPLETVYIGGGTPSLWTNGADFILHFIQQLCGCSEVFEKNYEFTLEINPTLWSKEDFYKWQKIGVNRFSIGIQSLNDEYLHKLGRGHAALDALNVLSFFRDNNINYSCDFLIGLPEFGIKRDIIAELKEILKYSPKHLSVYILTPKDDFKFLDIMPSEEKIADEYLEVASYLKSCGFLHYEVSNFCIEGYHSRHNTKYWKSETVLAFGPSATGFLNICSLKFRYKWEEDLIPRLLEEEELSAKEFLLERLYLALRTSHGIVLNDFFSEDEQKIFKDVLFPKFLQNDVVQEFSPCFILNTKGFLLLDSVMNDIFLHLKTL